MKSRETEQTEVEGTGNGLPLTRAITAAMSGPQVLRGLKTEPGTAAIPVVILSADASRGVAHRLPASGALANLTKPIELAELGRLLDTFAPSRAQDQQARTASRIEPA